MTSLQHDPASGPDQPAPEASSDKPERPSVLQTLAGALTAITVTYLMSFLGVAGTVIGVGLVSILTVLGNYLYTSAMHSAKEKIKHTNLEAKRRAQRPKSDGLAADDSPTATTAQIDTVDSTGRWRRAWKAMTQRHGWGKIMGSVALVFALLAGTVTVIEMSAGQPLSDIVRNEDSSGTTFFGGAGGGTEDDTIDQTDQPPPPEENQEVPPAPDQGEPPPPEEDQDVPPEPDQGEVPEQQPEEPGPVEEPQQDEQPAPEEEAPQQ